MRRAKELRRTIALLDIFVLYVAAGKIDLKSLKFEEDGQMRPFDMDVYTSAKAGVAKALREFERIERAEVLAR